ncbi:DUF1993 domain-containing protein [Lichenifustis flavocetrariae]|uniref:DUF1993 domain-containing protein n=1 Tax=Lichenifustis flavocetrariae TaxID=2949735 RepID=A0AA42CMV2_9HYPH|nr:DUF1993 domain-containing protein [Lichenifustis flavocetrariae]MCW6511971.1 DUF1993 domain-containing protein [Lichenifustis flavocetrariae]
MAISLYDVSIGSYLQTLDALSGVLDKGLAHFREHDIDPETIVETRLFPDMLPFRFQVMQVAFHATATIAALKSGSMSPPGARPSPDYAGLQALIAEARATLRAETPEAINARDGAEITFTTKDSTRIFTTGDFVLTFSLPNVHFHATTAYDILRQAGVPLGKRDFMGAVRTKG